jgi:hypothetical protein
VRVIPIAIAFLSLQTVYKLYATRLLAVAFGKKGAVVFKEPRSLSDLHLWSLDLLENLGVAT